MNKLTLKDNYKKILICPQSTDTKRNFSIDKLDKLLTNLQKIYKEPEITIASIDKSYFRDNCNKFLFEKKDYSSIKFIELMKNSDLVVCPDSGPLHIALALKKDLMVFMTVTIPEIVINTGSSLIKITNEL